MASTPTARNRFNKQGVGDNSNTWGTILNEQDFDLIDEALDGYESIAVNANVTLTSTNYTSDQARNRVLKFTGAGGFNVTIPGVEKWYLIHNACTAAVTVKTVGGVGASAAPATVTAVYCDGTDCTQLTNLFPMSDGTAAAPGLYFSADTNTGLYRSAADTLDFTTGGVNALSLASAGAATFRASATFGSNVQVPDGNSILFGGTGSYVNGSHAGNTLDIYTSNVRALGFDAAGAATFRAGATFAGIVIAPAATTAIPSLRAPHGVAPTAPTNGDIWTTTAGLFARINGKTLNATDLVLLAEVTASASASIDFSSATLTGDYNSFLFTFRTLKFSVDGAFLWIRQSHDNGTTIQVTNYEFHRGSLWSGGTSYFGAVGNAAAQIVTIVTGNDVGEAISGNVWLHDPHNANSFKAITWELNSVDTGGLSNFSPGSGLCKTSQTAVNFIRFLPSTGTFSSGTVRVYGLR